MSEGNLEGSDERGGAVRYRVEMEVPFEVYMQEAREAGVPEKVAFRRDAKRMREDAVRSVERRATEQIHSPRREDEAAPLREELGRERRRADRLEEEARDLRERLADAEGRRG